MTHKKQPCKLHKAVRSPVFKQRVEQDKKKEQKKQGIKEDENV